MFLLQNFLANEFPVTFTQQMNILFLCLSYSGMKYETLPFLGERIPRKKLDFIDILKGCHLGRDFVIHLFPWVGNLTWPPSWKTEKDWK